MDSPIGKVASKPLFRDPVYDGAADPIVIWNRREQTWLMLYTNRRASMPDLPGVSWVHGSQIGIAESRDCGATWRYLGTAEMDYADGSNTFWAPDVIYQDGVYHMYLTYVPGIHMEWVGTRRIDHLVSADLLKWEYQSTLQLASQRVIDASVIRLPDGNWRLFYNNESDHKSVYFADSSDLYNWRDGGKVLDHRPGEGPKVFWWRDRYWMVLDHWCGLGVYHSSDTLRWTAQEERILDIPGHGIDDMVIGLHADVVVSNDRAYLFYFTHPGRQGIDADKDAYEQRRSSIQVVELKFEDGQIRAHRDEPTLIALWPPTDPI